MIVYYNNLGLVWIIKFVNKYIIFWVKFIFIFKSVCFLCDCIFFIIRLLIILLIVLVN